VNARSEKRTRGPAKDPGSKVRQSIVIQLIAITALCVAGCASHSPGDLDASAMADAADAEDSGLRDLIHKPGWHAQDAGVLELGNDGSTQQDADAAPTDASDGSIEEPEDAAVANDPSDSSSPMSDAAAPLAPCPPGSMCGESLAYPGSFYCFPTPFPDAPCPIGSVRRADGTCLPNDCSARGICPTGAVCVPAVAHPGDAFCRETVEAAVDCAPGTAFDASQSVCLSVPCDPT
jgi:hypothetical protein